MSMINNPAIAPPIKGPSALPELPPDSVCWILSEEGELSSEVTWSVVATVGGILPIKMGKKKFQLYIKSSTYGFILQFNTKTFDFFTVLYGVYIQCQWMKSCE